MTELQGQAALVTGGGGGIGRAICRRLAAAGAQIIITYSRDQGKARAAANALAGGDHLIIRAPVDDSEAQTRLAAIIAEKYGRLDILVNNAGITKAVPHADLASLDDETIDQIFRINWRGAFASIRALQPLLAEGAGGVVVNISSIAGRTGVGSNVAYCASKAAMDSMTRSLARALAPRIRVLSVSPGWVNGEYAQRMPRALIAEQEDKTPLGRIAEAEDVAEAVYAAVTHLRFSTGDIIPVDGGRPLG
ncbi:MAG: SDR family NAD(P)-dependent oxidoreductase [Chloroflexota bacterium]|nr:SDR family NAD(P)-dependent oxidoreductase [Chloroflexota bacterium]MDE2947113.1 SDR family NAD(P)-dependent oxidoreductase [Chloroflexota bacterium]